MGKRCAKCGYTQPERASGYEPECPKCGALYSEAGAAPTPAMSIQNDRLAARPQPSALATAPAPPPSIQVKPPEPSVAIGAERMRVNRQWLGVGGGAALIMGAFLPLVRMPIVGSLSFLNNAKGDGVILTILGAASIWAAFVGRYKVLPWTGGVCAAIIAFAFYRIQSAIGTMQSDLADKLKDNPFSGLATALTAGVQMEFGWVVVAAGALAVIAAGLIKPSPT